MPASRAMRLGWLLIAFLFSVFAPLASAQNSNTVLLESLDKSVSVSGELVEAADGQYRLSTIAGIISVDVNTVSCTGAACPQVTPNFQAGAEVKLTSADGAVNVIGSITDIVDGHYVIENAVLGSVKIAIDLVECSGEGCPTGQRFADSSSDTNTATPATEEEPETTEPATPTAEVEPESTEPALSQQHQQLR